MHPRVNPYPRTRVRVYWGWGTGWPWLTPGLPVPIPIPSRFLFCHVLDLSIKRHRCWRVICFLIAVGLNQLLCTQSSDLVIYSLWRHNWELWQVLCMLETIYGGAMSKSWSSSLFLPYILWRAKLRCMEIANSTRLLSALWGVNCRLTTSGAYY